MKNTNIKYQVSSNPDFSGFHLQIAIQHACKCSTCAAYLRIAVYGGACRRL